jgi:FAD/FMN-containing dehydrogenase
MAAALGPDRVRAAVDPEDRVDGLLPGCVARPGDAREVALALAVAAREKLAVIPTAGGTKRGIGAPPERADVLLDLGALANVQEWSPRDGVLIAGPALTVAAAEACVAADAQTLLADWPSSPHETLGGCAAVGFPATGRVGPAGPRWSVIGMEVAHADGSVSRHGARVAKNVAGLDLTRLHVGALGTLGVITELTLRARPRAAIDRSARPTGGGPIVTAVLGGDGSVVVTLAVRLPEGRLAHLAERLAAPRVVDQASPRSRAELEQWLASLRGEVAAAGGSVTVLSAPPDWKPTLDVWGAPPKAIALMRRLKQLYDPARVLNPGRHVGGI